MEKLGYQYFSVEKKKKSVLSGAMFIRYSVLSLQN